MPIIRFIFILFTSILFIPSAAESTVDEPLSEWEIVKKFGENYDPQKKITIFNESITLKAPTLNADVYNFRSGKVVYVNENNKLLHGSVVIKSEKNLYIVYANLDQISPDIKKEKWIDKGFILGKVKNELILQTVRDEKHINPEKLFAEKTRGNILDSEGKAISISPLCGYQNSKSEGQNGLQKFYDKHLVKGDDLLTTIDSTLQKKTEDILDTMKVQLDASEALAIVMDSKSGELIAVATSNRYDPLGITNDMIASLDPKFETYPFEPGSVIFPITLSMALENGYVTPKTRFDTYNGQMHLDNNYSIRDDQEFESLNATDIIVYTSNIGISQIAWQLEGKEFYDGLKNFGFGESSGIDLPRDLPGMVKPETMLADKLHRANTAYGYGMLATPMQLLKAYNVFANDGLQVNPHISILQQPQPKSVVSKTTADQMKKILIENVNRGTAKKAQRNGLTIGGMTGTAHIAKDGHYTKSYNSSFFGFVEDEKGHNYTIGVLVIEPTTPYKYFASQSAVPIAGKIIDVITGE